MIKDGCGFFIYLTDCAVFGDGIILSDLLILDIFYIIMITYEGEGLTNVLAMFLIFFILCCLCGFMVAFL